MSRDRRSPAGMQIDHIIPLNIGGTDIRENVRVICRTCNLTRPKDGSDVYGQIPLGAVA